MQSKDPARDGKAESIIRITIPLKETDLSLVDVLGFGGAMKELARKFGGNGRVFRGADSVWIDLSNITREQINPAVSAYGDFLIKKTSSCKIVTVLVKPIIDDRILSGEYLREKLTRKLLFELPIGAFVISNLLLGPRTSPHWTAHLSKRLDRERLWEQAIAQGVAQRMATVVWSEADCALFQTHP
jgi:hypothetical protein